MWNRSICSFFSNRTNKDGSTCQQQKQRLTSAGQRKMIFVLERQTCLPPHVNSDAILPTFSDFCNKIHPRPIVCLFYIPEQDKKITPPPMISDDKPQSPVSKVQCSDITNDQLGISGETGHGGANLCVY